MTALFSCETCGGSHPRIKTCPPIRLDGDSRWAELYNGEWSVGWDGTRYGAENVTAETAQAYVDGTLDFCSGCMMLQPAFPGEIYCAECELVP